MKLIRAEVLGFCMGVRRAVEMAHGALDQPSPGGVYSLGPLIHNPRVLKELKDRGLKILGEEDEAPPHSTILIRAHGLSPQAEAHLTRDQVQILDATCPHVKANQKLAQEYASRNFWIFLAGEADHAEIVGIKAYGGTERCTVIADRQEAEGAARDLLQRAGSVDSLGPQVLIGQTTISPQEYQAIGEGLREYFPGLVITHTICGATSERQGALEKLCRSSDAIIIAGGKESANTHRLYTAARLRGLPAWIAESPQDIPPEIAEYAVIGLCAGASSPEALVGEIEEALILAYGAVREPVEP
ncbi:MAG: 4-hydroxy-3-methylbut-2-enyl diphosphate reductase [Treponema sp.]|nr:4-hydroxy-3-methylbut-2-enyl diphosphate reductase [Treponema sp.]